MRAGALLVILLALASVPASSYVHDSHAGNPVRWPNARATVYHDPATITGATVTELRAALAAWSGVSGSSFVYTHGGASPSVDVKDSSNGNSDVYFDNLAPFAYAVTIINTIQSANIAERDIVFNRTISWTTSASNVANGPADFRTVAIHELGHVLGLRHEKFQPSVMGTGTDPAFAAHNLLADDVKAMRFLYPAGGPTPGPDLRVDLVTFSPPGAGPGDSIEVTYTIRNSGDRASGGFTTDFRLAGATVPSVEDRSLDSVLEATLAPGVIRTDRRTVTVPSDLLPGTYRPGVLLDASASTSDVDRSNNGGTSTIGIRVERAAWVVAPFVRVEGRLGPTGRDEFLVAVMEGTRLRVKAKQSPGAVSLAMLLPDGVAPVKTSGADRRAKLRDKVEETGLYRIWLDSHHGAEAEYVLKLSTKALMIEETVAVVDDARVPFYVAAGCRVRIKVTGRQGLLPGIAVDGVDTVVRTNSRGTKTKIRTFEAAATGALDLRMWGRDGTTGVARVRIWIEPPRRGPTRIR